MNLDWTAIEHRLDTDGVATTPPLLTPDQCGEVTAMFDDDARFRSTIQMARYAFGEGSYRYWAHPPRASSVGPSIPHMPTRCRRWCRSCAPGSTRRSRPLRTAGRSASASARSPTDLDALLAECAALGQSRPTPLVLRYGPGGYNCLHQDVYGDLTFPLQFLIMLSRPDEDFTGGESVFVEQRLRQQSRPIVLRPRQGEAVIFPVRHRPRLGSRGYGRVQMRHGVSAVHTGERHVLGVIFHNAR